MVRIATLFEGLGWESCGTGGAAMSVRVREETAGSERRVAARAWPMKPLAPVMKQLIWGGIDILVSC